MSAPSPGWIAQFRAASGLPVGGWSVLRDQPQAEAQLAAGLVSQDGLDFYIADAEQEYAYTNGAEQSGQRFDRSAEFVAAFRAAEPSLPVGLSSYCRPDRHDLDWAAWATAGFVFLPQAYVGDLGPDGAPAVCVRAAAQFFPPSRVHPTLALFGGPLGSPSPADYGRMLVEAGTTGFSLYPAETAGSQWQAYGEQIRGLRIARVPS